MKIITNIKNYITNITRPCLKNSLRWGNVSLFCLFFFTKFCYDKHWYVFIVLVTLLFICQWLYNFVYISELKDDE